MSTFLEIKLAAKRELLKVGAEEIGNHSTEEPAHAHLCTPITSCVARVVPSTPEIDCIYNVDIVLFFVCFATSK